MARMFSKHKKSRLFYVTERDGKGKVTNRTAYYRGSGGRIYEPFNPDKPWRRGKLVGRYTVA